MIKRQTISFVHGLFKSDTNAIWRTFAMPQKRDFYWLFSWLNRVFNMVDKKRLETLGPDLVCAEWLLRNGGSVRFKGHQTLISDYNELIQMEEDPESIQFCLEEIYAKDIGLSYPGFQHFKGCACIKKITFEQCPHVNQYCIERMQYVKNSLQYLKIKSCYTMNDNGVMLLTQFGNLNTLILNDLPNIKQKAECEAILRKQLPNCNVLCNF